MQRQEHTFPFSPHVNWIPRLRVCEIQMISGTKCELHGCLLVTCFSFYFFLLLCLQWRETRNKDWRNILGFVLIYSWQKNEIAKPDVSLLQGMSFYLSCYLIGDKIVSLLYQQNTRDGLPDLNSIQKKSLSERRCDWDWKGGWQTDRERERDVTQEDTHEKRHVLETLVKCLLLSMTKTSGCFSCGWNSE